MKGGHGCLPFVSTFNYEQVLEANHNKKVNQSRLVQFYLNYRPDVHIYK